MIGGLFTLFVAIWVFQTVGQLNKTAAKKKNAVLWAAGAALLFFLVQYFFVWINVAFIGSAEDRSLSAIGDRAGKSGDNTFVRVLVNTYYELFPILMGFIAVAVARTMLILREKITVQNLFSGIKDMKDLFSIKKDKSHPQ